MRILVRLAFFILFTISAQAAGQGGPPEAQSELKYLVGLAQSIKARDEEKKWERLTDPPTKRAIQSQTNAYVRDYLAHLPRNHNNPQIKNQVCARVKDVSERIEVLRKRRKHFGPQAQQYSAARHPEFSADEYIEQLARAVAHIVWALEHNCPDEERRRALASIGERLLLEAYLTAGATKMSRPFIEWPNPILYVASFVVIAGLDLLAEQDLLSAIMESLKDVSPAIIFITIPLIFQNRDADRKALANAEPLMETFWTTASSNLQLNEDKIQDQVWSTFLKDGPTDPNAVSADSCEAMLSPLIQNLQTDGRPEE